MAKKDVKKEHKNSRVETKNSVICQSAKSIDCKDACSNAGSWFSLAISFCLGPGCILANINTVINIMTAKIAKVSRRTQHEAPPATTCVEVSLDWILRPFVKHARSIASTNNTATIVGNSVAQSRDADSRSASWGMGH